MLGTTFWGYYFLCGQIYVVVMYTFVHIIDMCTAFWLREISGNVCENWNIFLKSLLKEKTHKNTKTHKNIHKHTPTHYTHKHVHT